MKFTPITDAGSITARWSSPSSSSRSVSSASIEPGRASPSERSLVARQPSSSSTSSCSSTSIETSCSTNSGLPSAASTIRPRTASGTATVAEDVLDHPAGVVVAERRELDGRVRDLAASRARSSRSGRVAHRTSSGAPSMVARRCAIRSSSVASAQWMSSKRSASGRSEAMLSSSFRTPQKSSVDREVATVQTDRRRDPLEHRGLVGETRDLPACDLGRIVVHDRGSLADDLDQRPERDAAPVRQAPAAEGGHLSRRCWSKNSLDQARLADARLGDDRDDPAAAGGDAASNSVDEGGQLRLASDQRAAAAATRCRPPRPRASR